MTDTGMSDSVETVVPSFEVVVAHYDEDLSWLQPLAEETTVYTKGVSCPHYVLGR
jgi:hypothetical protein